MKQKHWLTLGVVAVAGFSACAAETKGGGSGAGGFGGSGAFGGGAAVGGASGGGAFGGTGAFGGGGVGAVGGGIGGNGGGAGSSCAQGMASAARVLPTVMLVVDGSCSMSTEYPGGSPDSILCLQSATNRWSTLRTALVDPTMGVVPRLEGVVKFGLGVYGTIPTDQCPFVLGRIDPAINNAGAIANGLPAAPPGLSTPTPEALTEVFNALPDSSQVLDMDIGPQIVILATDGAPNGCETLTPTQQQSLAAAMLGQSKGIKMFVISLAAPSGPLEQHLQQMANVGDPTNPNAILYKPTAPAELSAALEQIIGGALGCDVALNGRVTGNACVGTVLLNSTPLTCNDPNGWVLADESHIRLQGTSCDEFKANTASIVTADFPCNVFVPD